MLVGIVLITLTKVHLTINILVNTNFLSIPICQSGSKQIAELVTPHPLAVLRLDRLIGYLPIT